MKYLLSLMLSLLFIQAVAQPKTAKDIGFTHIACKYKSDDVDILVKSKTGEENVGKPLFIFCQGSQPKPLIVYDTNGTYGVFPFSTDSIVENYHLVIISKPYVPLIADAATLGPGFNYADSTGMAPKAYSDRNLLSYYTARNIHIIKYLQKQSWVSDRQLILAGHSEGATVAAKMASQYTKITHLIFAGGNPLGRIMSIIQKSRSKETGEQRYAENDFNWWKSVVENKESMDASGGDTDKATYEFSEPPIAYLDKLKIPVMVAYGTRDYSSPFNDYLQADMIRKGKRNFTFNAYVGWEHNFFTIMPDGRPDYTTNNWTRVTNDWLQWINRN